MGCVHYQLDNPSKYESQQIIQALKLQTYEDFVISISSYKDYLANKKYEQLMNQMNLKIRTALSKIEEEQFRNAQARKITNDEVMQFNSVLQISCENISFLCLQIDEINKIIAKQKVECSERSRKLKQQWNKTINRMINSKIRSSLPVQNITIQPQNKSASQGQMQRLRQSLKIQENLQRIVNIAQVSQEQINVKQKDGVFETEKNAIVMKFQRQIQRIQSIHRRQVEKLKQDIIRNNIKSNQALKSMNVQNNQKCQSYCNQIDQLNKRIKLFQIQIEEKNNQILELQNRLEALLTSDQIQSNTQPDSKTQTKNSFLKKKSQKYNTDLLKSFESSQIYEKFLNSRILCTQTKEGRVYRNKIDNIFDPIIIENSKQIFCYDDINSNNMNDYINEEKDLLFVAKLQNGTIVGGFSKEGFKQINNSMANNLSFIFSLHPDNTFYKFQLKSQSFSMHSVRLDSNYLKFGANELRISCGKKQGICTVSSPSCIFEQKNMKNKISLKQFIREDSPNLKLKYYEVYRLYLRYPLQHSVPSESKNNNPYISSISTF